MKTCLKCGFTGDDVDFTKSKRGCQCKKCTREYVKSRREILKNETKIKICSKCGFEGESTHFRVNSSICKECIKTYNKEYRDTINDDEELKYQRNEGGRKRYHKYMENPEFREKRRTQSNNYNANNRIKVLLKRIKSRSDRKGYDFNLTEDDIIIPTHCPVLGIPLEFGNYESGNSPSIDRIDSTKGYTKDNIIIVSIRANTLKNGATKDEMALLYKFYVQDNDFDF